MRISKEGFCTMAQNTSTRGAARAQEPTVGPWLAFDLSEQIEQLQQEPYWQSGRNSKTIVHHEDFRMVVTAIQANTTIHEHRTAGRLARANTARSYAHARERRRIRFTGRQDRWWWIRQFRTIFTLSRTVRFCSLLRGRTVNGKAARRKYVASKDSCTRTTTMC